MDTKIEGVKTDINQKLDKMDTRIDQKLDKNGYKNRKGAGHDVGY